MKWWRWALVTSPDGVAPSRMVSLSASVNLPLRHKVQKFSTGTGSPGWSREKGRKTVVVSIPSLSTRIVPLRFQAGGHRKRPNLGLVCCVYFVLSVLIS